MNFIFSYFIFSSSVGSNADAHGVVDVESLFRFSLSDPAKNEGEREGSALNHNLRHILENMEVFVVDSNGNVVGDSNKSGKEITEENFLNWKYTPTEPGEYKLVLKQKVGEYLHF